MMGWRDKRSGLGLREFGLLNSARFGLWIGRNGWKPTGKLCAEHSNMLYKRGDDLVCSGELLLRWTNRSDEVLKDIG